MIWNATRNVTNVMENRLNRTHDADADHEFQQSVWVFKMDRTTRKLANRSISFHSLDKPKHFHNQFGAQTNTHNTYRKVESHRMMKTIVHSPGKQAILATCKFAVRKPTDGWIEWKNSAFSWWFSDLVILTRWTVYTPFPHLFTLTDWNARSFIILPWFYHANVRFGKFLTMVNSSTMQRQR